MQWAERHFYLSCWCLQLGCLNPRGVNPTEHRSYWNDYRALFLIWIPITTVQEGDSSRDLGKIQVLYPTTKVPMPEVANLFFRCLSLECWWVLCCLMFDFFFFGMCSFLLDFFFFLTDSKKIEMLPCEFIWIRFIALEGHSWRRQFPGKGKQKSFVHCTLLQEPYLQLLAGCIQRCHAWVTPKEKKFWDPCNITISQ